MPKARSTPCWGFWSNYGVIELVRSGAVAVTRGPRALSEKVVGSEVTGR